ncbi:type IV toxin-antitoxin system AbiEi family antitoxin domain-containing protein [Kribbella sp. NPDC049584]|uniref:type IV toxin-antitoxin system AbiEi family antitoxin domain-containing protein n=1 Tax=Kribbella sp. NPDC049584 TaxID=3154833 RepID=UPI00342E3D62
MNPRLEVVVGARGGWFSRADAAEAGYSAGELRLRVRQGRWLRLSRDVYVDPSSWPASEASWDRARRMHVLATRAVVTRMGPDAVVSHQSAAVLHGLPTWGLDLSQVHVTRPAKRTRSDSRVLVHRSPIDTDEITEVDGIRITTPARTVAETTCTSSYDVGVVLADAAVHRRLVTPAELIAAADRHKHWPGVPRARAAALFADGLSESVGESRLRVLMADEGLPHPRLQVEIRDQDGRLIGRVDFLLFDELIVEFDGVEKYGDNGQAVVAEKWREDRLRARGYQMVRVSWRDLDHPRTTADRIREQLPRAA